MILIIRVKLDAITPQDDINVELSRILDTVYVLEPVVPSFGKHPLADHKGAAVGSYMIFD